MTLPRHLSHSLARRLPHNLPHADRGFGLAELMVALAIIGILAIVGMPAWQQHLVRAWRVQARVEIVTAMLALERHALATTTFAVAPGDDRPAGQWPRPVPPPPAAPRHWLTATTCAGMDLSRCVEVRATPVVSDARCGTLVLRSTGEWLSIPVPGEQPTPLERAC